MAMGPWVAGERVGSPVLSERPYLTGLPLLPGGCDQQITPCSWQARLREANLSGTRSISTTAITLCA
jgi:hypothetical protein